MNQILIGLSGYARSGKTTAADYIQDAYNVRRCHIATPLRAMLVPLLRAYRIPEDMIPRYLEGDLKETVIPGIGKSGRQLQISLGTEWGRELVTDHLWATAWVLVPEPRKMNDSVRFPNEEAAIQNNDGFTILIRRQGTHPIAYKWGRFGRFLYHRFGLMWGVHDSERVDRLKPDHVIDNNGSIDELHARIAFVVESELALRGIALS